MRSSVEIVAECGQTHSGSVGMALKLVDEAKAAGCVAAKFQHLTPTLLAQPNAALYWHEQNSGVRDQRQAFAANGSLTQPEWETVAERCRDIDLEFMSTPFDPSAVHQLRDLGVRRYKVASGDLTNRPLLEAVAATGLPVVMSSGAAAMDDIDRAVEWWRSAKGNQDVTILACSLIYPCPPVHAHLARITRLRDAGYRTGLSDHTAETETALAATALGATLLEKHFCLGPSHVPDTRFALTPERMAEYVRYAQLGATMIGECGTDCEAEARRGARRSVCAARVLPAGHQLTADDLVMLRPAGGIPPSDAGMLVGVFLARPYAEGEPFDQQPGEPWLGARW